MSGKRVAKKKTGHLRSEQREEKGNTQGERASERHAGYLSPGCCLLRSRLSKHGQDAASYKSNRRTERHSRQPQTERRDERGQRRKRRQGKKGQRKRAYAALVSRREFSTPLSLHQAIVLLAAILSADGTELPLPPPFAMPPDDCGERCLSPVTLWPGRIGHRQRGGVARCNRWAF